MVDWNELSNMAANTVRADNNQIAHQLSLHGVEQEIESERQWASAKDLHEFLEQYKMSQKEQARENEKNRKLAEKAYRVSVAATIFGGASLIVAVIALVLPLLK